jgi:hypothetical protein
MNQYIKHERYAGKLLLLSDLLLEFKKGKLNILAAVSFEPELPRLLAYANQNEQCHF